MPELPEVEVLARHLRSVLIGRVVREVAVHREKSIRPDRPTVLAAALRGARFESLERRAKYLVFGLRRGGERRPLLGHLGMTGRMYLAPPEAPLPKHAAVVLQLDCGQFVFEDTRYFGRLTLDASPLNDLGPEPLAEAFTVDAFQAALRRSRQAIKVKLLDQTVVAGVGNIYASEALFRARLSPTRPAGGLTRPQVNRLRDAVRTVLQEAIAWGSTVPLNWNGPGDGLFYYGRGAEAPDAEEKLLVYDRAGQPCPACRARIRRIVQAARSTYFCPRCQRG